ncbi:MAG: MarR family transcriptional regulator, partial [Candidatus Heimdallarchaeota archaeon]
MRIEKEMDEVYRLLEHALNFRILPLVTISSQTIKIAGLNEEQMLVLTRIEKTQEDVLVTTIAEDLFLSLPKASRIINTLVQDKYVKRSHDELTDRRKIKLEITEKGLILLEKFYREIHQFYKEIFESLG